MCTIVNFTKWFIVNSFIFFVWMITQNIFSLFIINLAQGMNFFDRFFMLSPGVKLSKQIPMPILKGEDVTAFHVEEGFVFGFTHSKFMKDSWSHFFVILKLGENFISFSIKDCTKYLEMSLALQKFRVPQKLSLLCLHLRRWWNFPLYKLVYSFLFGHLIDRVNELLIDEAVLCRFDTLDVISDWERLGTRLIKLLKCQGALYLFFINWIWLLYVKWFFTELLWWMHSG